MMCKHGTPCDRSAAVLRDFAPFGNTVVLYVLWMALLVGMLVTINHNSHVLWSGDLIGMHGKKCCDVVLDSLLFGCKD